MKIIITYASAGAGHLKAAEAIYDYLKVSRPETDVKIVDILEKSNVIFKLSHSRGYPFLVNHLLYLWLLLFWVTSFKPIHSSVRAILSLISKLSTADFSDFLIRESPDVVISTHFLSSEISCYLKQKGRIKSRLITVITDFGVHPYWICKGTDIYITASGFTKEKLVREGVEEARIKDFGIPINAKFLKSYDENGLLQKFNLKGNRFTVLIATGSFGIGPIEEIVDLLHQEAQVLVVCAKNTKLYQRLKKKNYPGAVVMGFVDNIEELMSISDIIITKPGGLSISESLAMDLLPIFIAPIPGQEMENIRVLSHYGIGIYPRKLGMIKDLILDFKKYPEKLNSIKKLIAKIKKPYAAQDIANVIC